MARPAKGWSREKEWVECVRGPMTWQPRASSGRAQGPVGHRRLTSAPSHVRPPRTTWPALLAASPGCRVGIPELWGPGEGGACGLQVPLCLQRMTGGRPLDSGPRSSRGGQVNKPCQGDAPAWPFGGLRAYLLVGNRKEGWSELANALQKENALRGMFNQTPQRPRRTCQKEWRSAVTSALKGQQR